MQRLPLVDCVMWRLVSLDFSLYQSLTPWFVDNLAIKYLSTIRHNVYKLAATDAHVVVDPGVTDNTCSSLYD